MLTRGRSRRFAPLLIACLLLPVSSAAAAGPHSDDLPGGEASISTVAGDPTAAGQAITLGQDPGALAIAPDGSSLYILDSFVDAGLEGGLDSPWTSVRELEAGGRETAIAGDGNVGFSGEGGLAIQAELHAGINIREDATEPSGLAVDGAGDLLISDAGNGRVRLVAATNCANDCPYGLASTTKGDIYTVAGNGVEPAFSSNFSGDGGPAIDAQFEYTAGLAVDGSGDLLISDSGNDRVRLVAAANCTSDCPYGLAGMTKGDIYTIAGDGEETDDRRFSGDGGPATEAELDEPGALAVDGSGDVLISDTGNDRVRLVAAANCASDCPYGLAGMVEGNIYTIAGAETSNLGDGGPATDAMVLNAEGLALDSAGDLLISSDKRVRLVAAANCASDCPYGLEATVKGDIYTVAGGGSGQFSDDEGPATEAVLSPTGLAVDSAGDLLISDTGDDRVRLVAAANCASDCPYGLSTMIEGDIYTIAGNGTVAFSGDGGPATEAGLSHPEGLAVDSAGDKLIGDTGDDQVRLVAAASCPSDCPYSLSGIAKGDIYTVTGDGTDGFSGDGGPATEAELSSPEALAVDSTGDKLISDSANNRVRLVAAANCASDCPYGLPGMTKGDIYTVAGNGSDTDSDHFSGDDGPAVDAELDRPDAVAVDSAGNLLIADAGNDRVRLVADVECASDCAYGLAGMTKGDIYTIAGNGSEGFSGDTGRATDAELGDPTGLAVDGAGNLLVGDTGNGRVRLVAGADCASDCAYGLAGMTKGDIYTIAGNGSQGFSGDGGPATEAELFEPAGLVVDHAGDLLIGSESRVRLVAGADCTSDCSFGLASMTKGHIYTVAGSGDAGDVLGDGGPATDATISPQALAIDHGGDLLISDDDNDRVRLVAAENCASDCPFGLAGMTQGDIYTIAGDGKFGYSGDTGRATEAEFGSAEETSNKGGPAGLAVDSVGNLLVIDSGNDRVRLVAAENCTSDCAYTVTSMTAGDIYTIAGDGVVGFSGDGGPATEAELDDPGGLAVDVHGDLLISDSENHRVRLIAAADCIAGCPYGLASMTKGDIYTVAGGGSFADGPGDGGPATSAVLFHPTGLAVDGSGDLLISDTDNNRVRLVAAENCVSACPYGLKGMTKGDIYTVAGNGTEGSSGDGASATEAELGRPDGLAVVGAGDLLISDTSNDRVRLLAAENCASECPYGLPRMTEGDIYTVAGDGLVGPLSGDGGPATQGELYRPNAIAVDSAGDLLISDPGNPDELGSEDNRVQLVAAENCTSDCPYGLPETVKGDVYTIVGDGIRGFSGDGGSPGEAELDFPGGLAVSGGGGLLVSDTGNDRVRLVSGGTVAAARPAFTAASPPTTALVGSTLEYTFAATGASPLTYKLAPGAPGWLAIDSASGKLTGTVPSGTTNFSYSVTATDSDGSRTAGPFFTAAAATVPVSGTVEYFSGEPAMGAVVEACLTTEPPCYRATTDASGKFTVSAIPGTDVTLTAYPPHGAAGEYAPGSSQPLRVAAGLQAGTIVLPAVTPPNVTLQSSLGPTTLDWAAPTFATATGCPNGLATVAITAENRVTGASETKLEVLPESQPGSGSYTGSLEPQYPLAGPAYIHASISCPHLSSLVPFEGPAAGGNTVTLTGSGLTGATAVTFGGVPATSYDVVSDALVEAVAPPGTGTVPATIYGPGLPGGSTVIGQYAYVGIQSVSPASGPPEGGTVVTITGAGLGSATAVRFGETAASFTQLSETELTAVSPAGEGPQPITVLTAYGETTPVTAAAQFTYTPSVGSAVKSRGPHNAAAMAAFGPMPGGTQTSWLMTPASVTGTPFALTELAPWVWERILAELPYIIDHIKAFGGKSLGTAADLFMKGMDFITNPNCETGEEAVIGEALVLLDPFVQSVVAAVLPTVELNTAYLVTAFLGPTGVGLLVLGALPVVVPPAVEWAVTILTGVVVTEIVRREYESFCPRTGAGKSDGRHADVKAATTTAGPASGDSVDANIDPSGAVLDVNGAPVAGATTRLLRSEAWAGPFAPVGEQEAGIQPSTSTETTGANGVFGWNLDAGYYELEASSPGCTAPGEPGQTTAKVGPYAVPPPQANLTITLACADEPPASTPAVTSLSETSGPPSGGTTVTVVGHGFTPSAGVTFGDTAATTVTYLGPEALTAVAPPGDGAVDVVVQTKGGSSPASSADRFFYGSTPTVTGLSDSEGPVAGGAKLVVSGTGFTGTTDVAFGGAPGSGVVVKSDRELELTIPPGRAGTVDVQVVTPAGTSEPGAPDRYTYEAEQVAAPPGAGQPRTVETGEPGPPGIQSRPAAPTITKVAESHRSWREGHALARISSSRKPPVGTVYSFTLNEPAKVSFAFSQQVAGRKVKGKCVAGKTRKKDACMRAIVRGSLSFTGHAGTNKVAFQGLISHARRLPPGRYTLIINARNAEGQRANAETLSFTILE